MTGKSKLVKTLSVILALVMLLGVMPVGSLVANAATENGLTYKVSDDKAIIISCDLAASGDLVIPETLGTYPVVKIDAYAFSQRNSLISVTIPDSVETIGIGAFSECDRLAKVKIGKGVTSIGNNAFSNSFALEEIEVSKDNTAYVSDEGALYNKDKTDMLVFPASNPVESFTVAEGVTAIKAGAFRGAKNVKTIVIGDKVTSIGNEAFFGSANLESITIGKSVASIGLDAFKDCPKFIGFNVSADNNVLMNDAFGVLYSKDTTQLIKYPEGNKSEAYVIADGTVSINLCAFENAIALKEITIPKSVTEIGPSAFSGCLALSKVKYGGSDVEWESVQKGTNNESLLGASFEFAGGVQHTHVYTESIYKDADCVSAGEKRFTCDCGHMYTEVIPAKGHDFVSNNCIHCGKKEFELAKDGTKAKITKYNGKATDLVIPTMIDGFTITGIGDGAFENKTQIMSITIPDGVTEIGNNAFFGTGFYNTSSNWENGVLYIGKYLIEVNAAAIGSSYTVKDGTVLIADYAFSNCTALSAITFPATLKVIGDAAFSGCTSLKTANCGVRKGEWSSVVIGSDNSALNENTLVFVPDPHVHSYDEIVADVKATCTTDGYKITKCSCGDEVREDYPSAGHVFVNNICAGCNGREYEYSVSAGSVTIEGCHESIGGTVNIPATIGGYKVVAIAANAFQNNNNFVNVVIPEGVATIGEKAFFNCDKLESVSVPASVVSIGDSAFAGCDKITAISVNANNISYSSDADGVLYNAGKTELVYYPAGKTAESYVVADSVVIIGKKAFKDITALKSVEIPEGVKTIAENAFAGCSNITDVVYGSTETKWKNVIIRANNEVIENATKTFKDTTDADLAAEHVKELDLFNAEATVSGINITIKALKPGVKVITVGPKTKTTDKDISVKTEGTLVKVNADGKYELLFVDCHKTNNETTATVTIDGVAYDVKFVFPVENGGHECQTVATFAPTCVAKGYTTYECIICDYTYDGDYVDALGHTYGDWVIDVDETCTEPGVKSRVCSVCDDKTDGHTETGLVPAKGHAYQATVTEPTCVEGGYTDYICSRCNDSFTGNAVIAKGHSYGEWVVEKERTCTEDGFRYKVCSACDETTENHRVEEVMTASGHDYETVVTPPTVDKGGFTTDTCKTCGHVVIRDEVPALRKIKKVSFAQVVINKDDKVVLKPTIETTDGGEIDCTATYVSENPDIATVDPTTGEVTGIAKGLVKITCTIVDENGETHTANCYVDVKLTVLQWIVWFFVDVIFKGLTDLFSPNRQ
ncbi:MAG: leucine-rich repeat protein [Clostridia bacterium]|nr:leucine-rich repeat protein [Clostridia bacterium]